MTARPLLRLYPRDWRARYGDEFVDLVGEGNLSAQQTVDIVAGAVDAWLSPRVRASVRGSTAEATSGGVPMIQSLKLKCATTTPRYTTKDSLIGAAITIGATALILAAGIAASRQGFETLGETLKGLAFPASMVLSMPFYAMKGQSRRAQAFFVVVPMAILIAISYLAART